MNASPTKTLGDRGESLAADYLTRQGYRVITRNWKDRFGELDIIAQAPQGEWVFVEVKTRRASDADPLESITPRKQAILIKAAQFFLASRNLSDAVWRIDVIAVTFTRGKPQIEHVQDALDW